MSGLNQGLLFSISKTNLTPGGNLRGCPQTVATGRGGFYGGAPVNIGDKDVAGRVDHLDAGDEDLDGGGHLCDAAVTVVAEVAVAVERVEGVPLLEQPLHGRVGRRRTALPAAAVGDAGERGGEAVGCEDDGDGGEGCLSTDAGGGHVVEGEAADGRVLPDVDGGADGALAVDEVLEGEGEVRRLVQRLVGRPVERLHEPLAQPGKVLYSTGRGRSRV